MRKTISLKIDLTKIDKNRIYVSDKTGNKYLDAILMFDETPDKYQNNGMIVQSVSKEERDKGIKGNILGNAKDLSKGENKPQNQVPAIDESSDLPKFSTY